jgi:hypothetical protein
MAPSILKLNIITFRMKMFSIMTHSITILNRATFEITCSTMTRSITSLSIITPSITTSKNLLEQNCAQHNNT